MFRTAKTAIAIVTALLAMQVHAAATPATAASSQRQDLQLSVRGEGRPVLMIRA